MSDRTEKSVMQILRKLFSFSGAPTFVTEKAGSGIISPTIKQFLNSYGISTSRSGPADKVETGEERFYGPLWRTIRLLMADSQAPIKSWHLYLPLALQALRGLLNSKVNAVPHQKLFAFDRYLHEPANKFTSSWLYDGDRVIFNDDSIDPPLAQEADLIQSSQDTAQIRLYGGQTREVKIEQIFPINQEGSDQNQAQQIVDLTGENDSITDYSDAESDISCLNDEESSRPEIPPDPSYNDTSPQPLPTTSRQPIVIPFMKRTIEGQTQMGDYSPTPESEAQPSDSDVPDSPPITRLRARQGSMVLRSGKTLPTK